MDFKKSFISNFCSLKIGTGWRWEKLRRNSAHQSKRFKEHAICAWEILPSQSTVWGGVRNYIEDYLRAIKFAAATPAGSQPQLYINASQQQPTGANGLLLKFQFSSCAVRRQPERVIRLPLGSRQIKICLALVFVYLISAPARAADERPGRKSTNALSTSQKSSGTKVQLYTRATWRLLTGRRRARLLIERITLSSAARQIVCGTHFSLNVPASRHFSLPKVKITRLINFVLNFKESYLKITKVYKHWLILFSKVFYSRLWSR